MVSRLCLHPPVELDQAEVPLEYHLHPPVELVEAEVPLEGVDGCGRVVHPVTLQIAALAHRQRTGHRHLRDAQTRAWGE